jgi:hypothetical protein
MQALADFLAFETNRLHKKQFKEPGDLLPDESFKTTSYTPADF